jgi:hypothetical protein
MPWRNTIDALRRKGDITQLDMRTDSVYSPMTRGRRQQDPASGQHRPRGGSGSSGGLSDQARARSYVQTSVGIIILRWILGVRGTAITVLLVSVCAPFLKSSLIDTCLPQFAQLVRDWASFSVPAWTIAVALAVFIHFRWIINRVVEKTNPDAELFAYITDTFGRRAIRNLFPVCSVHDVVLHKQENALACPRCGRSFPSLDRQSLD